MRLRPPMCSQMFLPANFNANPLNILLHLQLKDFPTPINSKCAPSATVWPQFQCQVMTHKSTPIWGYGGLRGSKMAPIEISSPHSYSISIYTLKAYLAPFGHNTQRGSQTTVRAIGTGRLCYIIGGLKTTVTLFDSNHLYSDI